LLERCDAFRRPELFYNLLLACQADAEGCGKIIDYSQARLWRDGFLQCSQVSSKEIIALGYEGKAIKEALHEHRVACIQKTVDSWRLREK